MKNLSKWFALLVCWALVSCGGGGGGAGNGADAVAGPSAADAAQALATSNALLDADGASFKLSSNQSESAVKLVTPTGSDAAGAQAASSAASGVSAATAPTQNSSAGTTNTAAVAPPAAPTAAAAVAQVVSLQKVSELHVSRTVYDYTFKVVLASPNKELASAQAVLVEAGAGTTILDPAAYFGAVSKTENAVSTNTISLRHDRTQPFDLTALRWAVSTYVTPTHPAMAMNIVQAELDPAVRLADGALAADPVNPLILTDTTGSWGAAEGTVLRFDGTVRKVLRVTAVGGARRLLTEEVPFTAAFKQLSYKATLSPLAEASLQPADPATASSANRANGSVARRYRLAAGQPEFLSRLQAAMLVSCITPVPAVEGETGELTVKFEIDCAISDLAAAFGKTIPNLGRIYGTVEHTSKDEQVFSLADKNNYVESKVEVKSSLGIELSAAGALPEWQTEGGSGCEKSTTGTECKFKVLRLKHFEKIFLVGGVPVPVTTDLDLNIVVDLAGSGGFKVYAEQSRSTTKGVRAGLKVDLGGDVVSGVSPTLQLQAGLAPSADFSAEGGVQLGADIDVGSLKFKALEGIEALKDASLLNVYVAAGGYVRAQPKVSANQTLCTTFDAGLKAKGEVTLIKSDFLASLGFDGLHLPEAEKYWTLWKKSSPNDCDTTLDSERVNLVAKLDGSANYAVNLQASNAGLDVLTASGQWLLDKAASGQKFTIDLTRTLTENPTFKNIVVEQLLDDAGKGLDGQFVRSAGGSLKYEFSPGSLQPGDKVRLRFKAYQQGKEQETVTLRGMRVEFEVPPAALPSYEFRRTAAGQTTYMVSLNFQGDSRSRVTSARIERAQPSATAAIEGVDGVEPVGWGYEQTGVATTAWMLNARQELGGASRQDEAFARPAFLLLETVATEGGSAVYRIPIVPNQVPRVDAISFDKPAHRVLQQVKVSIYGANLPPDLKLEMPWCIHAEEVDYDLEARRIGNEYSNVERFYTCTAAKAGEALAVIVLDGLGLEAHRVEDPLGFPTAYAASPLVQGEPSIFGLSWANGTDLFNNPAVRVMWDFGQGVVSALVSIYDEVKTVFATAGEKVLQLIYSIFGETFASRPTQPFTVKPGAGGVSVTDVSPLSAVAGVPRTFDVKGANLPKGLSFILKDCDNVTEVDAGTGPGLRRFTCTFAPTAAAGEYDGSVSSSSSIFGAEPYFRFKVQVSRPVVGPIVPESAMRTLAASFEVRGQNLPETGELTVVPVLRGDDTRSNCQRPHNRSSQGFGVACELYTMGAQLLEVKLDSTTLGHVTVNVTSNVSGVSWTSPSTANSGSVKFGETVTFAVRGSNLQADVKMGFAVELCGVSNQELPGGNNDVRRFSCLFNNEAGAVAGLMTWVVKDKQGGQVLYGGPDNVVQAFKVPVEVAPASAALSFQERPDTGSGWNLKVTITPKDASGNRGTFDFGLGQCTGTLTYKGKDGGGHHVFQENHLTGNCQKTCDIVIASDASFYNERCVGSGYDGSNISPVDRRWIQPAPTGAQLQQLLGAAALTNPANGRSYEVIECGSWTACRDAARARGGELVTVRSAAEQEWLIANLLPLAKNEYGLWIGLTDEGQEGVWRWASSEAVAFTNWRTGEPNNFYIDGRPEAYVHMWKGNAQPTFLPGVWNDIVNEPLVPGQARSIITQAVVEYAPAVAASLLSDDFSGTSLDSSKWTADGWLGTWVINAHGGPYVGPVSVGSGFVDFGQSARISTKDKLTLAGDGTIIIEGRFAGPGASRDTAVMLVDTQGGDHAILMGDTNYANFGFYGIGMGRYMLQEAPTNGDPTRPVVFPGSSTSAFMEYRLTLRGTSITIERGPTLDSITQRATRTLGQSIEGRSFYLSIGTAWAYFPGRWDWVRVKKLP